MPTEFACTIDTDGTPGVNGVDFTSLAAWESAMRGGGANVVNLKHTDRADSGAFWVVPGTLTGAIANAAAVTQLGTGATATLYYHSRGGQAFLRATNATQPNDAGAWRVDPSNFWTPTGPRDVPILAANCRGATPDGSAILWTSLVANGLVAPITIRGDLDPNNLAWDTSKYRWEVDTLGAVIDCDWAANNSLRLVNLQVRNASTNVGSWTDGTAAIDTDSACILAESCLFRGGKNAVYHRAQGDVGRTVLRNSAVYGATQAAVWDAGRTPLILQNCTLIGGQYGLRNTTHGDALAENCYAHGSVAGYSAASDGVSTLDHCASSDATGTAGLRNVARSTATFRNVTAGSEDFRLAAGSPLLAAGADLSPGRTRYFADVSSANENANGGPVGVLAFESGSSTAVFRLWNSTSDRWWDGTGTGLSRHDLSLAIPLPHPSTTSDWVALVSDTHEGVTVKGTVLPGIDALNAGTKGRWTRDTSLGWAQNGFPCAGRIKHLIDLGDLQPTDLNRYGDSPNYFRDNLHNTSGNPAGGGIASVPAADIWCYTGNHDVAKCKKATSSEPANPAFEEWRFNQHGRAVSPYYSPGNPYSDADELWQYFDVGNVRFLLVHWVGTGALTDTHRGTGSWPTWLQADVDWYASVVAGAAAVNLFVMMHAPLTQSTRKSFQNQLPSPFDVAITRSPWAASLCGHTHAFGDVLSGPDAGCVGTRRDFPTRIAWDVGAHDSGAGAGTARRAIRRLRVAGRSVAAIRA